MTDVLVAGIGNVFMGDDGFGVEVVRRLVARGTPHPNVAFVDFATRGFDLALALTNGTKAAILVDASARGRTPGTVTVLEPHEIPAAGALQTHGIHPIAALALARRLGSLPPTLRVVTCEPGVLGSEEDVVFGLSAEVEAAVPIAIELIDGLVETMSGDARDA